MPEEAQNFIVIKSGQHSMRVNEVNLRKETINMGIWGRKKNGVSV